MKHLKPFNESRMIERRIEDQCEAHLVYLLDEGYEVTYKPTDRFTSQKSFNSSSIIQNRDLLIDIKLTSQPTSSVSYNYKHFSWDNVKDRVIPLIQQLNKK